MGGNDATGFESARLTSIRDWAYVFLRSLEGSRPKPAKPCPDEEWIKTSSTEKIIELKDKAHEKVTPPGTRTDHAPVLPMDVGQDLRPVRIANTAEQPYQSDGIKLSRGDITQRPAADQLPEALSRHLKPHARVVASFRLFNDPDHRDQ